MQNKHYAIMKYRFLFLTMMMAVATLAHAQNISVTSAEGTNVELFLRNYFLGEGVEIYNVKFNNAAGNIVKPQIGSFQSNGFGGVQMQEGIVLTTGHVSVAEGPNDNGHANQPIGNYYSDPLVALVSTGDIRSCATLDFDLVCLADHLSFTYSFGSEEYPEYVGSRYNDVFAFFLTGIDPATGLVATRNIALVPGSVSDENPDGIAVAINSVNPGVPGTSGSSAVDIHPEYSSYYRENPSGTDGIQYNGYTAKLVAEATLVPCEVYHMHITICNIGDLNRDSGVMIEGHSLTSPSTVGRIVHVGQTTFERMVGSEVVMNLANTPYSEGRVHISFGGDLACGDDFVCVTDSGDIIDASRDYMYINDEPHSFLLRGTDSADLSTPRSIEVYLAIELCPQHPELLVFDTLHLTMVEDSEPPSPSAVREVTAGRCSIYPNPAKDNITVEIEGLHKIDLLSTDGRIVLSKAADAPQVSVDVSGVAPGVYTLRAATSDGVYTSVVIVE